MNHFNARHRFLLIAVATAFGLGVPAASSAQQDGRGAAPPETRSGNYGGMGPGMMGGYHGGYGYGPGMMDGYGPGMMGGYGPGMMGGYGIRGLGALDLSREQVSKIDKIRDEARKRHWELGGKMTDEYARLRDLNNADKRDPAAIGRQYAKVQDIQRQMMELSVDTDNRIESVLTNEQRTRLHNMRRWGD
ncbi:MAG TPA: Spy/CpxP family protein refolding chaperone [Burkholderiaceae bacterium]|nr:Spy/CpxP family protein refolding chaperone [Burkholderiaceae bacterium]